MRPVLLLLFSLSVALAQPAGQVRGMVLDSRSGEALARVQVQLSGSSHRTVTDNSGRFSLDSVPSADYVLHVTTVGYYLVRKPFSLPPGGVLEFEVVLSPSTDTHRESVEVSSGAFEPRRAESPAALELVGNEIKNLGSVLADDPLRAAQALPGVASNNDFDAQFSLRGAGFNRLALYLDGVLLHAPLHAVPGESNDGSLSPFHGDALDSLTLHAGAPPARFAEQTAGALEVETREGRRQGVSFRASASFSNAALLAEGPLGKAGRGSWLATVRKSYLQYLIDRTAEDSFAFGFTDSLVKLAYEPAPRHKLSFTLSDGFSALDRTQIRSQLGPNSTLTTDLHFTLATLAWRYSAGQRLLVSNRAAWLRERGERRNRDELTLLDDAYGEWVWSTEASAPFGGSGLLDMGWSLRRLRTDGVSNRYQFNPFAVLRLDHTRGTAIRAGGHVHPSWSFASGRVLIGAGLRWDRHGVNQFQTVSPSASVAFHPSPSTRLHLGWGHYAQYPDLERFFSVFGSRALLFQSLAEPRLLDGRVFNPLLNVPFRNALRGYARGAQVFLQRRSANGFTGWVSYAFGHSRFRDGLSGATFPSDFDQRHTVNVFASRRLRPSLNLSGRWIYGSGFPIPGFLRAEGPLFFLSEVRNGLRVPHYQRLDLRFNKAFAYDRWKLTLFGEVVNLLDCDNVRFDTFNGYDARTGRARLSFDKMFPILPSVGVVLEFGGGPSGSLPRRVAGSDSRVLQGRQ